jgi:DNA-directed RNA polymerase
VDLLNKQLQVEYETSNEGILRGIQQMQTAFKQGRAGDTSVGKRLLIQAFEEALPLVQEAVMMRSAGVGAKYRALMRRVPLEILTVIAIRHVISSCASPDTILLQDVLRELGRAVETEVMVDCLLDVNEYYVEKIEAQVQTEASRSVTHIQRKYRTGAKDLGLEIEPWTADEKVGVARILITAIYELGLFRWETFNSSNGKPMKMIVPSETLEKHLQSAVDAAHAIIRFPPMLVPPRDWVNYYQGGYLTDQLAVHAPLMSVRGMKKSLRAWVIGNLTEGRAEAAKAAANKAQRVPYRINKEVLAIAKQAMSNPRGILGLPPHGARPKPEFPFADDWNKTVATPNEIDLFNEWKSQMKDWYTFEKQRNGRKLGIHRRLAEMTTYQDAAALYFPAFFDWRGRLYFRSSINPQGHDTTKGILELAEGKRLGKRGLFWLWVHVANCCGYDKKDPKIRVQWAQDNWGFIRDYINDPLNVDPPEPDTSFTLLAAGLALQEALELPNPEDYICHVTCAQDATCSGLQHFSALLRDEKGARYTNLIDSGRDEKEDIYREVASVAEPKIKELDDDVVVQDFWKDRKIPRSMAKRPVMTYVYGSTLQSTMEYVAQDMDTSGVERLPEYSLRRLSVPAAKALRYGVEVTVPAAAAGMKYLQLLVRKTTEPVRWFSPVGIPVLNWSEVHEVKEIKIRSMGIDSTLLRKRTGNYDKNTAASGISPNFIHSLDSAHLCLTINAFQGQIIPIHDSFATHMCDVDAMHVALRQTFYDMYQEDLLDRLGEFVEIDASIKKPVKGALQLEAVLDSRFMFT